MELYRIKKWGNRPETYVEKTWCNKVLQNGKLRYFVRGKGYRDTKAFELINVDLEAKKDALYLGKVAKEYGDNIAAVLCETAFGCCTSSAENWVSVFRTAYQTAIDNGINPSDVATDVANNFRGFFGCLDVFFLDKQLSANDPEYNCAACTYKGKPKVSMKQYIKQKYGKPTAMLVEKLL